MEEDEEEVCNCTAQPYSTIPTELELQQMMNRLNVAQAGKELLKWNTGTTGVELKKISSELRNVYTNFGRDMRQAFLLLARCRYFNQDFYRNVTEGVKTASIYVQCRCTSVAGVNLLTFKPLEIPNKKVCKCPFLCRGGQAIQEATKAWSNLLMSHIKMVELRTNFHAIEAAYKDSSKRLNIINQIVLPKTKATINFILVQLEEITREESNRIKVKSTKIRNNSNISYVCSGSILHYFRSIKENQDERRKQELAPNVKSICDILPPVSLFDIQSEPIKQKDQPISKDISQTVDMHKPITKQKSRHKIDSLMHFYNYVSTTGTESLLMDISHQRMSVGDFESRKDLPKIDKATYAMGGLLEACKVTRNRLSTFAGNEKPCQVDSKLTVPLGQLKSHIDVVVQANCKLKGCAVMSKGVKNFVKSCKDIDDDLKYAMNDINTTLSDKNGKKRVQHLMSNIDEVVKIITDYKSEGILSTSLEEFSKICTETKAKIGFYNIKHELQKIDYLESYISNLESITTDITRVGIKTPSIQNFLSSCKGFREKLEEHKRRKKHHITEQKVNKSTKQKQEAQTEEVTLTKSMQQFITSCEAIIKRFQRNEGTSKIIDSMNDKNVYIAKLMTNLQNQGLVSKSTIAFLTAKSKTCKIDESNDENHDGDLPSCQSDNSNVHSELYNNSPAKNLQFFSAAAKKEVEQKDIKLNVKEDTFKEQIPKIEVKNVENVETLVAKVKENVPQFIGNVANFKENIMQAEEKTEIDRLKPTCKVPEDEGLSCSLALSETSETRCSDSSCMQSDVIVAEINTYDSCPLFGTKDSTLWESKSSDSWTQPLLPKEQYCLMCSSQFSSDSSDKQVCEACEKIYGMEEIVRAMTKTYTI